MKTNRIAAGGASIAGAVLAYVLVGPLPCSRSPNPRCGVVAYDYGSDTGPFPSQTIVTVAIFALVFGVLTWFWIDRARAPTVIRIGAGATLLVITLLAIAGVGGLIGVGAPFILPILWLAARRSHPCARWLWIVMAGLAAAAGSWLVAEPLGFEWDGRFISASGLITFGLFVVTTRSRDVDAWG